MLSNTDKGSRKYPALLLAISFLIAGCTTSPTSGRTQFNILPAPLESSVSDLRFGVKTMLGAGDYCPDAEGPCTIREEAEKLASRIAPIAERLGAVAPQLSPELVTRVPRVEVFVIPSNSASVSSSGGGKIAVNSGLGRLDLSDTDLALALAREFGRLAAAHHRESTSAGLAVSLVAGSPLVGAYLATSILADILFPMGSLIKLGISVLGSMGTEQLVEISQQEEADDFAGKLMLAAGYDLRELAEAWPDAPESPVKIGWLPGYLTSRARVAGMTSPADPTAKVDPHREPSTDAKADLPAAPAGTPTQAPASNMATLEIKTEIAAPSPVQSSLGDARQEPPQEVKAKAVTPPPEASAKAQDVPPEIEAGAVPPSPESASKAAADQSPPSETKTEVSSAMPLTPAATTPQEPAPTVKAEAAETLDPEEDPPEAKPVATKKANKTVMNKGKKPRKPTNQTSRR